MARRRGRLARRTDLGLSETDSFIDEVSEEVRRDKLFGYMRRYGWIAILAILAIVGAAAWSEWNKSQRQARAQALGDALLEALETNDDAADRAAALAAIETTGPADAVTAMLTAADQQETGDVEAALATLNGVVENPDVPQIYRDLAQLKMLIAGAGVMDDDARRNGLEAMAVPGRPFRMPALEQLALSTLAAGDTEAAIAQLQLLIDDAEASAGLQARAEALIVALRAAPAPAESVVVAPDEVADEVPEEALADEPAPEEPATEDAPTDETPAEDATTEAAQDDQ